MAKMRHSVAWAITSCCALLLLLGSAEALTKLAGMNAAMLELKAAIISGDLLQRSDRHNWSEIRCSLEAASLFGERRYRYVGLTYYASGEDAKALRAWKATEGSVDFLLGMGDYYASEGRPDETQVAYGLASTVDANNSRVLYRWGQHYRQRGLGDKALESFSAALLRNEFHGNLGDLVDCHYQLGEILISRGRWQEAAPHFEEAVALRPENPKYRLALARALYFGYGDVDGALQHANRAIELDSEDIWGYLVLSDVYMRERMYAQAIASASRAQGISPANPWSYVYTGRVYLQMGDYELARREFSAAIDRMPENADAHCYLGWVHLALQREEAAIAELSVGTRLDPNKVWCHMKLAEAYEATGSIDAAVAAYREVVALDPQNEQALLRIGDLTLRGEEGP